MKLFILIIFSVFAPTFANASEIKPLIVGGTETAPGEFPYIVSIQEKMGHICGGSLIRKNWVLTAGHCVTGTKITKIYIGLHDQKNKGTAEGIKPKRIVRHPKYDEQTTDWDYALIELSKNSSYPTVELNTEEIAISDEPGQQITATVAGWGDTSAQNVPVIQDLGDLLQKVDVPLASKELCEKGYPAQITDRMICAGLPEGKKDACYGDSGGPLIVKDAKTGADVQIGVVSWGEGCARAGKLGVYSKVNAAVDWINSTAQ